VAYDEKVWARLIVTLTAVGRPAAAQDVYRRVRTLLRRELGVTPGDELRRAAGSVAAGGDHGPGQYLIRGAAG
jgi:DNA-binding SARP family transcriptional activator